MLRLFFSRSQSQQPRSTYRHLLILKEIITFYLEIRGGDIDSNPGPKINMENGVTIYHQNIRGIRKRLYFDH
jgi:hypothetical protein